MKQHLKIKKMIFRMLYMMLYLYVNQQETISNHHLNQQYKSL